MMKPPLKGIIPPVVTPLTDNNTLDVNGLEKLLEHLITGGVHGLFILGTTGEAASLKHSLRKEVIRRTTEFVAKRIPVLAGISDTSFDCTIEMAHYAAEYGADGVVIAPPYYMPITQEEMREYLEAVVPKLPLPFVIYNIPSCTKLNMSVGTIRRAREIGAIGVKDSSGDPEYMKSLLQEFRNYSGFSLITGTEMFIPETISGGGHGAVPGGANIFPGLFVDLYEASLTGNTARVNSLYRIVAAINNTIYCAGRGAKIVQGIKAALNTMLICNDYVAWPLRSHRMEERIKIKRSVSEIQRMIRQSSEGLKD
jgi:2-dehydro-3-deoxy-D-pentonate aldolase